MVKGQKEVSNKVKEISDGIVGSAVDMMLVSIYYSLEFAFAGYGKGHKAEARVQSDFDAFNYETLKRSLGYLKRKGLVQAVREKTTLPKITEEGRRRLKSIIPQYDKKRIWDGRIYLVTYDLPVANNKERNALREFLKKIGCGVLQRSVWMTPYNPKKLIEDFVNERKLYGNLIIVSSLGRDGTVGDQDVNELVDEVYHLTELNAEYALFVERVEKGEFESKSQLLFSYFSILKDDPRLPFELLPDDWLGEKAYKLAMHMHS